MFEAVLYNKVEGSVRCRVCPHNCLISEGKRGICGVRENQGGTLYSLVYGRPCAAHVDPVEKKPLFHVLPGSLTYSIATVGCNLRCSHCQNHDISQMPKRGDIVGEKMSPSEVVENAKNEGCNSVSYTYTEPTIFIEYARDTSVLAAKTGLKNVFVSNGYMSSEALDFVAPHMTADNVDLKSFSDKFYREVCGASLEPVLQTLKNLVKKGIWVEVTTLIIPTLNDNPTELEQIASFIHDELGDFVPWHVSRFHPDYKLGNLPATDVKAIKDAVGIGQKAGLKYVYAGNVPHEDYENTRCPVCNEIIIERQGYTIVKNKLIDGMCTCNAKIEGVWT